MKLRLKYGLIYLSHKFTVYSLKGNVKGNNFCTIYQTWFITLHAHKNLWTTFKLVKFCLLNSLKADKYIGETPNLKSLLLE